MIATKKLIEVALPLESINIASAKEKSIRHGHPSTLHLWWARRPLATARSVIFAQMVDDPSAYLDELLADASLVPAGKEELARRLSQWERRKAAHEADPELPEPGLPPTLEECVEGIERERLFRILEKLVLWENATNEIVLEEARAEIWTSWRRTCDANADHPRAAELFDRHKLPAFHDPFAGGGALPLEAQRLGLEAFASDLNPVAVTINRAMIEIPPKFFGRAPVHLSPESGKEWAGTEGLTEDVRHFGKWMRGEAEKRIGHLYPKVAVTAEMAQDRPDLKPYVGRELTAIAWIWARTVKSPSPAYSHIDVPLASTFMLSAKNGKEVYVDPEIEGDSYRFTVKVGKPEDPNASKQGTKFGGREEGFFCLLSGSPVPLTYIRSEGRAGRMGSRLMAIVCEGDRERVYFSPTQDMERLAKTIDFSDKPDTKLPALPPKAIGYRIQKYGMTTWSDLFTPRQTVTLTTLSDLVAEACERVKVCAAKNGLVDDGVRISEGGSGVSAYADAVGVYLALSLSRVSQYWSSAVTWHNAGETLQAVFGRQAISMAWDYTEGNPFSGSTGNFSGSVNWVCKCLATFNSEIVGTVRSEDASTQTTSEMKVVSTDPPYYDNIGYADLSDFFYIWLRRSLKDIYPDTFSTVTVPKIEELIADPYRHGSAENAENFYLDGMTQAVTRLAEQAHSAFPVTIYYALKQSRTGKSGMASTGWEAFLDAMIHAGFALTAAWPMKTEMKNRARDRGESNALTSSMVMVCRKRGEGAPEATCHDFLVALKAELPGALRILKEGNIAPVDLVQASIGPGMSVYSRYARVLDAEGEPITVKQALTLINQILDEALAEQEVDFDAGTRWALAWFKRFGFSEGPCAAAEALSKEKATPISSLVEAGILESGQGHVRLLRPTELAPDWDPIQGKRLTVWEIVHRLIRVLEAGEEVVTGFLVKIGTGADIARELAYRLYSICERKRRATEALDYNRLVQSWPEIARLAQDRSRQ